MYNIVYLQKAIDDLDELHRYIAQDNEQAANKMVSKILSAINGLILFPFTGSCVNDRITVKGDYRMSVVKPYLVFYRVIAKDIVIYRVLHGRRYHDALLD
ncbi:MAG: type II toxin-antitoxin system RelE/ParE family toxin [Defluviitaleaceae bacterium]|nr:type II toxin-antitoxin system RelE/ParE family toxin [Defluviitaleaceae bacterium]